MPDTKNTQRAMTREEIAAIEVGHTEVGTGTKIFLVATFVLLICLVPVVEQFFPKERPAGGLRALQVFNILPGPEEWSVARENDSVIGAIWTLNARMLQNINEFEDRLEDESDLSNALIPSMQSLLVGRLKAGNENVYCGRDEWLFFRPGIDYLMGRGFLDEKVLLARSRAGDEFTAPPQPDPVKAIVDFRDQLSERGIQLLVVPAPVKPMVYPEMFSRRYSNDRLLQNASYELFNEHLAEADVLLFDPADALMEAKSESDAPFYLATDTHWTPDGLSVAARALADFVRERDLIANAGSADYRRVPTEIENLGDVAHMLNLPDDQTYYRPERVIVQEVYDAKGNPWRPERNSEILLLGDSFANIFSLDGMHWGEHAGLAEQLSMELQAPLDAMRINNAGAYATREQLSRELLRGEDRLAGKKLVIWEFAARELSVGDWKLLEMRLGEKMTSQPRPGGPIKVTGTIAAITRPPRPASVPYRDCVIAMHLTGVQSASSDDPPDELVVFLWGMRESEWTDAARFDMGQELSLELVPWDTVQERYGSYNRIELDDDALLFLDIYWVAQPDDAVPAGPSDAQNVPELSPTTRQIEARAVPSRESDSPFQKVLLAKLTELETLDSNTLLGRNGWMFFGPELRHLTVGPFWGADAPAVSRASNPDYSDPLPAILDFNRQLEGAGIQLLMVPVPSKAIVYPNQIDVSLEIAPETKRFDETLQNFYGILRENGINVLDLTAEFIAHRDEPEGAVFCLQDTHWSGRACVLAAEAIAREIGTPTWLDELPKIETATETRDIEITGDLWRFHDDSALPKESLLLDFVSLAGTGNPVKPSRESPIVLLGDSHTLVFSAGQDMHAEGAGLPDQLAHRLKTPIDLVGVRGSGATPARMSLLRRRDNMAGKKLVIWCFTAREFTEASGGWRILPVIR